MSNITTRSLRLLTILAASTAALLGASQAAAFPQTQAAWQERYGGISAAADNARCQLCHVNSNRELQNPTNGLSITKNGIRLIGQTTKNKRVVLENAGNQRNGIVVVPEDRTDCMSCHTDLAPPFPVKPGVPPGLKMRDPMLTGFEIRGLVEGNVNGLEVSNSDDILLVHNEARNNTVGAAILLLPDIFDDRPGAKRIDMRNNWIHDNNKPNTARPGSILSFVPSGTGVLYLGVDDSTIANNRIENNGFTGIAIADYCLTVNGTPYGCSLDPDITLELLADQSASGNTVVGNTLVNNGTSVDPGNPFAFAAADLTLLSLEFNNCYADNEFGTGFSILGLLPPCP